VDQKMKAMKIHGGDDRQFLLLTLLDSTTLGSEHFIG